MLQAIRESAELAVPQPAITVASRYNGPPGMGNGGVTVGLLSRFLPGPVEVTLRRPVPLDRPLALDEKPGHVALWHDYALIASARPTRVDVSVPSPVTFAEAVHASRTSKLHREHPFPTCFVCGTHRSDGLDIIPGAVPGRDGLVATTWVPRAEFAENGSIAPEFVYGALDCPSGIAAGYEEPRPMVLGRLAGDVLERIVPEARYVAIGWREGVESRKHFAGSALFTERGQLVARAIATWFDIPGGQAGAAP